MSDTQLTTRKLPTLNDLIDNKEIANKNDQLNYLLNQETPKAWIKKHPYVNIEVHTDTGKQKQPLEYVPIEKTKQLLTQIFQEWNDTIKSVQQVFNSVCVVVTLRVRNPLTGEWIEHDGIGAVGVQTDKGENAANLNAIKQDAVMKAAPAAASYALKNAAEKLGSLFGGNLQRYDLTPFMPAYNTELKEAIQDGLKNKFEKQSK